MTGALVLCFLALQASFVWARYAVFRIDGPAPQGVRLIEVSVTASIVAGASLIALRQPGGAWRDLLALAALLLSALLFGWGLRSVRPLQLTAAFSADAPVELLRSGAYGVVRNPFYAAYIVAHAVPALATASWWALPVALWMAALYTHAALLEERKFLAGPLAGDFRAYAAQTGRFLPRWRG